MDKKNTDLHTQKLKLLRINSFFSQKSIASKLKISQQAYGKIEDGKTQLSLKNMEKLCKIFKIEVVDFLTINPTDSKIKNRSMDSFNVKVLKEYHEIKLLEKQVKINALEEEVRKLKRIKAKLEERL